MCGICGRIGVQPVGPAVDLAPVLRALHHRGPDACDLWRGAGGRTLLGHTRLSILDLEGSSQPMANEDGSVIATYNGEIYNFAELRGSLLARGHRFRSVGDTEVLVHLYEELGPALVSELDGMFAFALYDARHHSLLLARDPAGIKPLVYWHDTRTGDLVFASDLHALLAEPSMPRRMNHRALAQFLHFGYAVHPDSWIENVTQVSPGEWVRWQGGRLTRSRYYAWEYRPDPRLADPARALDDLRDRLTASVGSQLVADVPLGGFLSGGLDSSTVLGLAGRARQSRESLRSFTVKFWVPELDESVRSAAIAAELGTQHSTVSAEELPFDRRVMDELVTGLGEPFGDTSALAMFVLCGAARPMVKVALSGDGGDEVFLGYTGLARQRLGRALRVGPAELRRRLSAGLADFGSAGPRRLRKYLELSLRDDAGLIIEWARRWEAAVLPQLLRPDLYAGVFPGDQAIFPEVRELIGPGRTGGFAEQQLRFHLLVDLPCDNLFKVDRMAMAHSLEVRVPLLSNAMLEYASRLPAALRHRRGRTKEPLRTLAESLAPTLRRPSPKQGFSFPLDAWSRALAPTHWRDWGLVDVLTGIGFQRGTLERLLRDYEVIGAGAPSFQSGTLARQLFDLMLLGLWVERHGVTA
jgi:asparagine synthase (glutamine-hydrolysing)